MGGEVCVHVGENRLNVARFGAAATWPYLTHACSDRELPTEAETSLIRQTLH